MTFRDFKSGSGRVDLGSTWGKAFGKASGKASGGVAIRYPLHYVHPVPKGPISDRTLTAGDRVSNAPLGRISNRAKVSTKFVRAPLHPMHHVHQCTTFTTRRKP